MKKKIKKPRVFGITNENTSLSFLMNLEEEVIDVLETDGGHPRIWLNAKTAKWLGERLIKASLELSKK